MLSKYTPTDRALRLIDFVQILRLETHSISFLLVIAETFRKSKKALLMIKNSHSIKFY
jgi:hypothetical protein